MSHAISVPERASKDWRISTPPSLQAHYEVLDVLGEGTFGRVYLVRTKSEPSRLLAAKHIKPGKELDGVCTTALREISLLRTLRHPNIVRMDAFHMDPQDMSLVMALDCAAYDVYEILKFHRECSTQLPLYTFKSILWQLLRGLVYLHANWVLHRDLKPSNLLLMGPAGSPEHGTLKIADFGLARVVRAPLTPLWHNGVVATIWYRAPELLLGAWHHGPRVDVWAAGCVAGELLSLRPLFQGEEVHGPDAHVLQVDQLRCIFRVMGHPSATGWTDLEALTHWRDNTDNIRVRRSEHGSRPLHQHLWEGSALLRAMPQPEALVDLMGRLLTMDPVKRISAQEALEHPFFQMEPLPGNNVFVQFGRQLVSYPSRVHRNRLPDHLLLACFSHLDWTSRFQVLPLVCHAWAELACTPAPELWHSVTVDFTSHIWLRASRLANWLRTRGGAVRSLSILNSDASTAPWVGGWVPGARLRSTLHDFYPQSEEGLMRVVAPLHALRELRIARCDDLLQRDALGRALCTLPALELLDLATIDQDVWRGIDWRALSCLRELTIRCGPANFGYWSRMTRDAEAESDDQNVDSNDPNVGFPLPLADLTNLTHLRVWYQGMRRVPDDIALLRSLRSLTLASRGLHELPAAMGALGSLEELSLSGCALGGEGRPGQRGAWALPPELAYCPLRRLDLMNCYLDVLPVAVGGLHLLEELSLGCNSLSWLPDNLGGLTRLRSLSLFSNDFQRVPNGVAHLVNLEELFLDANPRLQFGSGATVLHQLPRLRCLSVMQDGCESDATFDFWSESSIQFLHTLDLALKKRHGYGRGCVRIH